MKRIDRLIDAVRRRAREALGRQTWIEKPHRPVIRPTLFRVLLGVATTLACAALLPLQEAGESLRSLREGDVSPREVVAPFTFPVLKTRDELAADRARVLAEVPAVFHLRPHVLDSVLARVRHPFAVADSVANQPLPPEREFSALRRALPGYSDETVSILSTLSGRTRSADVIVAAVSSAYSGGVVPDSVIERLPPGTPIVATENGAERTLIRERVLSVSAARDHAVDVVSQRLAPGAALLHISYEVVTAAVEADLEYDSAETEIRRRLALEAVSPSIGIVMENERIVGAHERVTADVVRKIESLLAAQHTTQPKGPWGIVLPAVGRTFFVGLVVFGLGLALAYFKPLAFENRRMLVLIAVLFVITLATSEALVVGVNASSYLIPAAFAPMLVAILIEAETAFVTTVALSLLLGLQMRFDFGTTFYAASIGVVGALSVMSFRNRGQIYRPMFLLGVTAALVVFTLEGLRLAQFSAILGQVGRAVLAAVATPVVVIGVLPLLETLFGLTSEITLLELSDLNRPLLRELALRAPGTFHHSIIVGTLSEAAALAIGANPLLARVGAYYHDIGKMDQPGYFVENQSSARSKHERLSPSMSALVIESHIRKGEELAERHGLPAVVVDFIEQHHGTSVMTFFYQKAVEQGADPSVESEFRYPGPLPKTREAAILMLADAVEAASRAVGDATPARMRSLVHRIIRERVDSGQLAEANPTLLDLSRIEDAFVPILLGTHHSRVEYPLAATE